MKRGILVSLQEVVKRFSKKPWGCIETTGPDDNGRVAFSISCNDAFIKNLKSKGFQGMTDEETVQLFFISMRMVPEDIPEINDTINPASMPNLSNEANKFVR